jgi:two-component system, NtrC family, response regulator AtoC
MEQTSSDKAAGRTATAVDTNAEPGFVLGASPAMQAVGRILADLAPTDIPVLIVGDSGTGKRALAMEIHRRSQRCREPFLALGCAGLEPKTFSSSSAGNGSNGSPAFAEAGTVFLHEISELDAACQPRLLEALAARGADSPRLISSSHKNLEQEVRAGRFREDLYYRLSGVCLRLPPLRHRKEDIPELVDVFLAKYSALLGRELPTLRAGTLAILLEHSWPGNVRELENALRTIVALADEDLALSALRPSLGRARKNGGAGGEGVSLKETARAASRQAERELILKVLSRTRWNRKRAAEELQISYKALLYKLKQIGLDDLSAT